MLLLSLRVSASVKKLGAKTKVIEITQLVAEAMGLITVLC